MTLEADTFPAFFREVHGHAPFPWQIRLLQQVSATGEWPGTLDLPTGSGKTAAIDIAVFHLALEAENREKRRAPVRISFVVDRRLVVDDAFARAEKVARALADPPGPATASVAQRLRVLAGDGPPLIARRLRGGIPREDDWARTPSQPTVLCSTVDQVGSRLLFRGYGVSDSMKPVHAGLIGSDCLILLDEAHLAEPFRQTLGWVQTFHGRKWSESGGATPWNVVLLTATPTVRTTAQFSLDDLDHRHPVLERRLNVAKPARLVAVKARKEGDADGEEEESNSEKDVARRVTAIVAEVRSALLHFRREENGVSAPAIGIVVNRVLRAREVFKALRRDFAEQIRSQAVAEPILMIGPARELDREQIVTALEPIRTRTWSGGERRALPGPLLVVATQCLEAGVDIDLDGLISEAAPIDALRQRFGRLNRAGRNIRPFAAIIAAKSDISARHDDPVYGKAIKPAWDFLSEQCDGKDGNIALFDFGLNAFNARIEDGSLPADATSPKPDAPVLLPAHLDLLSDTSPIPAADPDVALYLHGPHRQPDSITVIWRVDVDEARRADVETRRLITLMPPRSSEAIELPIWAVRRWLLGEDRNTDQLADVAVVAPQEEARAPRPSTDRWVFRWKGDDDESRWILPRELRPGDTIIAPCGYRGVDRYGWNGGHSDDGTPATDLGHEGAIPFAGRRFAVRVAPGLLGETDRARALAETIAANTTRRWRDLRDALLNLALPDVVRSGLDLLDDARRGKVFAYTDIYGDDSHGRPRGVVFVAPLGLRNAAPVDESQATATEDDIAGSLSGFPLSLEEHSRDVANYAETSARAAGLPESWVADLKLAGQLHDAGKADRRFQAWMQYGDPFGPDPNRPETILAKSGRDLPRIAREASGLPKRWRHEALSVRLAKSDQRFNAANDPELVLWLIGTHHGHGRPFYPHHDPAETLPEVGPQSLAFEWQGIDWPSLFALLKARYGLWELARMEAIVRLADHRASDKASQESGG